MSAANKGVLSTARTEEGSEILTQNCASSCTFQSYIGLDEPEFTQLMVYPNPASNTINLSIENAVEVTYEIFDLLGNLVASGQTYSEIDISSLVSGSYLLMVQDEGMLRTGKLQVVK